MFNKIKNNLQKLKIYIKNIYFAIVIIILQIVNNGNILRDGRDEREYSRRIRDL